MRRRRSAHPDMLRYAEWIREKHLPPPIRVLQREDGRLTCTDGHRRLAAADMAGAQVLAWVSWLMPHPAGDRECQGRVLQTTATWEAVVAGHWP